MVVFKRASEESELKRILALQQRNLYANVPKEEQLKEGFVTVSHTFDILKRMNDVCPHIIAKDGDKVVGYALCMHPEFSNEIEVLRPMFDIIETRIPNIGNYIAMGQVCVDKDYRKKGIFRSLYQTMQNTLKSQYEQIITEVDAKNKRSLQDHYSVGFKLLSTHISGGQEWKLIGLGTF